MLRSIRGWISSGMSDRKTGDLKHGVATRAHPVVDGDGRSLIGRETKEADPDGRVAGAHRPESTERRGHIRGHRGEDVLEGREQNQQEDDEERVLREDEVDDRVHGLPRISETPRAR